ncbi:protein FAM183A isoform X2 [Corvus cornix cornix]|uniref:protein FAM183A isoform X2 n=1 Tax=Corvus moneduloides TaxID=1196302 RepID=UPI00136336A9|nr:protein FAM183A isoform X2 [Corvus moneduloides]XP_039412256.1 protein FAM183A isoform X2 [Corvus cornix cornix]XP_041886392.1 protein FAM183A isoform X2 [Corvus kubaryi]XP_048169224.1 protein FAM183A isoform X2 [Corvus hawaiiensis]
MADRSSDRGPPDALQNRFHSERANKERQWQLVFTKYTVNPLQPDEFLNLLHRAVLVPRKKYSEPQTESQEIGWNTTPLVPLDRTDRRFYFPRRITEITIHGYPAPRGEKS